jgi:acylphosphatase
MKQRVTYNVIGRVQGVGYRFFVYEQARINGLLGYVKNLYDGSVEVCVEIESDFIQHFRNILSNTCSRASVENVTLLIDDSSDNYLDFRIY